MLRRILITTSILTVASAFSFASGCSSSSGNTGGGSGSSSGVENDATGSSSGVSGSSSGSGDDATGSSSGTSSSSSGSSGGGDAGANCLMPATTVPSSEITPYKPVMQTIGACTATDISGYIAACDSANASQSACTTWFNGATAACGNCLQGPATGGDPGIPTGQGGIWIYPLPTATTQGGNIGANLPGCLDKEGMSACAPAFQNIIECLVSAGCFTDPSSTESCSTLEDGGAISACQTTVLATGGACHSYLAPYQSACAANYNDGGLLNGGACQDDQQILSVLCGNGTGDGG